MKQISDIVGFNTRIIVYATIAFFCFCVYRYLVIYEPLIQERNEHASQLALLNVQLDETRFNESSLREQGVVALKAFDLNLMTSTDFITTSGTYISPTLLQQCRAQDVPVCQIAMSDNQSFYLIHLSEKLSARTYYNPDTQLLQMFGYVAFVVDNSLLAKKGVDQFYLTSFIEAVLFFMLVIAMLYYRGLNIRRTRRDIQHLLPASHHESMTPLASLHRHDFEQLQLQYQQALLDAQHRIDTLETNHGLQLVRASDGLQQMKLEKEQLAENMAKIAHDLRNAVHAINANLLILGDKYEGAKIELEQIIQISESMNLQISNILNYNALQQHEHEYHRSRFNLHNEVQRFLQIARAKRNQGVDLLVYATPATPVYINSFQLPLMSVIENLLFNALKYTHRGQVECRVDFSRLHASAGDLIIHIRDTGSGIESVQLETIFDKYQQHSVSSKNSGGVGLGLSMVKNYCDFLNADLSVKSQPGVGTEFIVTVPVGYEPVALHQIFTPIAIFTKHRSVFECLSSRAFMFGYEAHHILALDEMQPDDAFVMVEQDVQINEQSSKVRQFTTRYPCDDNMLSVCDLNAQWRLFLDENVKQFHSVEHAGLSLSDDSQIVKLSHEIRTGLHVMSNVLDEDLTQAANMDMLRGNMDKVLDAVGQFTHDETPQSTLLFDVFEQNIQRYQAQLMSQTKLNLCSFVNEHTPRRVAINQRHFIDVLEAIIREHIEQAAAGTIDVEMGCVSHNEKNAIRLTVNHYDAQYQSGGNQFYYDWHTQIKCPRLLSLEQSLEAINGQLVFDQINSQQSHMQIEIPCEIISSDTLSNDTQSEKIICVLGGHGQRKKALMHRLRYLGADVIEWYDTAQTLLSSDMLSSFAVIFCLDEINPAPDNPLVVHYHPTADGAYQSELHGQALRRYLYPQHTKTLSTLSVLMIDDQVDNLMLFKAMLENTPVTVSLANSAEEALEGDLSQFDIIFSDINLEGGMSGLEFSSHVRNTKASDIPIVLCSAAVDHMQSDIFAMPNIQSLPKPFSKQQVIDLLHTF